MERILVEISPFLSILKLINHQLHAEIGKFFKAENPGDFANYGNGLARRGISGAGVKSAHFPGFSAGFEKSPRSTADLRSTYFHRTSNIARMPMFRCSACSG